MMNKILLVCKETYAYPMNLVIDDLKVKGFEVEVIFIHSTEVLLKDPSYISLINKHADTVKIHTLEWVFSEYLEKIDLENPVDLSYLEYVEKKYCQDIPLSLLQVSSQYFTTPYHYRFFFSPMTEVQKLYWLELNFRYIEKLLAENDYDMIWDLDIAELGRSVLHVVSNELGLKYVTLEFSRYNDIVLPTFNLGRKTDDYFIAAYNKNSENPIDNDYISEVNELVSKKNILSKSYLGSNTAKKNKSSTFSDIKKLLNYNCYLISTIPNWFRYRKLPPLANPIKSSLFFMLWFYRERVLLGKNNKYFEDVTRYDENYVYFPLHLIPESTTLNKSPHYPNEYAVIAAVSKSLPVGWKVYVKEHGAMIGERPLSFYKELKKLTNVRLARLDCYDDPKPWIEKSKGVVTLSGTSAFEATYCGKKSIMFGNAFFELIAGVDKCNSFDELPSLIKKFDDPEEVNVNSIAAYIKTVKDFGVHMSLPQVIRESEQYARFNVPVSKEVKTVINNLTNMYIRSMEY
ncbi:hypothetical protein P0F32_003021 [Vibrio metschnikovii]|nr:hypothetical protein [Vibrio metschnikovii]